jgi:hypothetical protein
MKFGSAILGLVLVTTIVGIYLFRGFDPDEGGAFFRPYEPTPVTRYFKTPQTACKTIVRLVEEEDWAALAQFYDLEGSQLPLRALRSGEFFKGTEPAFEQRRPFDPRYSFKEVIRTEYEDVYEVVVTKSASRQQTSDLQFFYLKRYAEGYRLLPKKPTKLRSDTFR